MILSRDNKEIRILAIRNWNILIDQFKCGSWREILLVMKKGLFLNEHVLVYKLDIARQEGKVPAPAKGFKIEKGRFSDLEQVRQQMKPVLWEFQCHEYDNVKDFFIARNGKEIQHISWIYFHNHHNRFLKLSEKEAEIKYSLTFPDSRGRGVYSNVIRTINAYLYSKDIQRVYMCVNEDNYASIRGIEKVGFEKIAEIRFKKILGIQISSKFATEGT